jgi:hypothetical protein
MQAKVIAFVLASSLQRHNTKNNSKQIFPGKELRGVPNSCVRERFIYSQDRSAYSAAWKYVDRSCKYINRSQTHECGNWDWGPAIPFLGIHKWDFRCSAMIYSIPTLQIIQLRFYVLVQRPHIDGTDDMNHLFFRLLSILVNYPLCSVFLIYCPKVKEKKLTLSTWSINEINFKVQPALKK